MFVSAKRCSVVYIMWINLLRIGERVAIFEPGVYLNSQLEDFSFHSNSPICAVHQMIRFTYEWSRPVSIRTYESTAA